MKRSGETRVRRDQRRYTPAVHSRPVFTDPSGRRRRAMRRIGLVAAAALAICLGAVVVAMAGGPAAPFTDWAAPRAPAAAPHNGGSIRAPEEACTRLATSKNVMAMNSGRQHRDPNCRMAPTGRCSLADT